MGLAVADFNGRWNSRRSQDPLCDGPLGLYQGTRKGQFNEVTLKAGLAVETRYVSWGAGMPTSITTGFLTSS